MSENQNWEKIFAASTTALRELREEKGIAHSELVNCLMQFRCIQGRTSPFNATTQQFTRLFAHMMAVICSAMKLDHKELTDDADRLLGVAIREFIKGEHP